MATNREWLYSMDVADLAEWFDAEHEANDTLSAENDVSAGAVDANDAHAAQDMDNGECVRMCPNDSREKLEADILRDYLEFPGDRERITAYINRQASITERRYRELTCTFQFESDKRIAELQAKVTDLQIQLEAMSDVANDYRFERDELQDRVDTLTRYIHDIKQIARKV